MDRKHEEYLRTALNKLLPTSRSAAVRFMAKVLLGRNWAERSLSVLPDDTFLVSYPKSGNTWLRFLVANLREGFADFSTIESAVPDIYLHTDKQLLLQSQPRILKSHEVFDPRYPRVVYLVRDPRAVLVSHYYYSLKAKRINCETSLDEFSSEFLAGKVNRFGSWNDNVRSWLEVRQGSPSFLLVRYEDLLLNTISELKRVSEFLGWNPGLEMLRRASECSSAGRMRALEREQGAGWGTTKYCRTDIPFVRRATAEGWKSELPDSVVKRLIDEWGDLMVSLGYSE